jgi:hypothetical protein
MASAMHGQTTGHADGLSGHELGIVTQKECNDAGAVIRLPEPPHGNCARKRVGELLIRK